MLSGREWAGAGCLRMGRRWEQGLDTRVTLGRGQGHPWLNRAIRSHPALDTLFVPLLVGAGTALVTGATVLGTITCCFMKRLRKR